MWLYVCQKKQEGWVSNLSLAYRNDSPMWAVQMYFFIVEWLLATTEEYSGAEKL